MNNAHDGKSNQDVTAGRPSTAPNKIITIEGVKYELVGLNVGRDAKGQPVFGGYLLKPVDAIR